MVRASIFRLPLIGLLTHVPFVNDVLTAGRDNILSKKERYSDEKREDLPNVHVKWGRIAPWKATVGRTTNKGAAGGIVEWATSVVV